jgi:hypothetical protein
MKGNLSEVQWPVFLKAELCLNIGNINMGPTFILFSAVILMVRISVLYPENGK